MVYSSIWLISELRLCQREERVIELVYRHIEIFICKPASIEENCPKKIRNRVPKAERNNGTKGGTVGYAFGNGCFFVLISRYSIN